MTPNFIEILQLTFDGRELPSVYVNTADIITLTPSTSAGIGRGVTRAIAAQQRAALDFFDALVALGLLERTDSRYANTPATDLFLDRAKTSYIGGILEMFNSRLYGFWGR